MLNVLIFHKNLKNFILGSFWLRNLKTIFFFKTSFQSILKFFAALEHQFLIKLEKLHFVFIVCTVGMKTPLGLENEIFFSKHISVTFKVR